MMIHDTGTKFLAGKTFFSRKSLLGSLIQFRYGETVGIDRLCLLFSHRQQAQRSFLRRNA